MRKVGDRILLRRDSTYWAQGESQSGIITNINTGSDWYGFKYTVRWGDGRIFNYREIDLEVPIDKYFELCRNLK
jgi:hypothetical protein